MLFDNVVQLAKSKQVQNATINNKRLWTARKNFPNLIQGSVVHDAGIRETKADANSSAGELRDFSNMACKISRASRGFIFQ